MSAPCLLGPISGPTPGANPSQAPRSKRSKPFTSVLCTPFFITWIFFFTIFNPLLIWYQSWYVDCTISPLAHQSKVTNQERYSLRSEFTVLCILNAFIILFNSPVGYSVATLLILLLEQPTEWVERKTTNGMDTGKKTLRFLWTAAASLWTAVALLCVVVAVAVGVFIALGQFVSPFVTADLAWRGKYSGACEGLDMRVYLDSTDSRQAHKVGFVDMVSGETFTMGMDPDPTVWGLDENAVYSFGLLEGGNSTFERIRYDLAARTFEVLKGDEVVRSGGFGLGRNFSIPALGIRGDLKPFSRRCVFDPTVEVFHDQLGDKGNKVIAMKTVQFRICDRLQVCAERALGDTTAVAVGLLVLQRAGRPGDCCRGAVVPGVAGRDGLREGRGWDY